MDNYKKMYYKLFNKMTDIAEEIKRAQQEPEEMFIEQGEDGKDGGEESAEALITASNARPSADTGC